MVLFLDDSAVHRSVTMDDALVSVRAALAAQGTGQAHNTPRQRAQLPHTSLAILGGSLQGLPGPPAGSPDWVGAKLSVTASAGKRAWLLLFDSEGTLRSLMVAGRLGQLRTGAATGVSTDVLARPDARVLACLGAGYQASTQIEAVARVRPIDRVLLWARRADRAHAFAVRLRADLGLLVEVAQSPAEAVRAADIVVTVTGASTPVLHGADVRTDAHVVLVGSNHPQHREADAALFSAASQVYADDLDQAGAESGDLRLAVTDGALTWADVALLGPEVLRQDELGATGAAARSAPAEGPTVFCSQGVGTWDVALAATAYERARQRRLGVELPIDGAATPQRPGGWDLR